MTTKNLGFFDIPTYLGLRNSGVTGITLVGVLNGKDVTPPKDLQPYNTSDTNSVYGVIDIIGIHMDMGKFYTRGQVLTLIPANVLEHAKAKKSGKLAVTLSGGKLSLQGSKRQPYLFSGGWRKGNHNNWLLTPLKATPLNAQEYPEFMDVIAKSYKNNWEYVYPVQFPKSFNDCSSGVEFIMYNSREVRDLPSVLKNGITTNTQRTNKIVEAESKVKDNPNYSGETQPVYELKTNFKGGMNLGGATSSGLSEIANNRNQAMIQTPDRYSNAKGTNVQEAVKNNVRRKKPNNIDTRYEPEDIKLLHIALAYETSKARKKYFEVLEDSVKDYNTRGRGIVDVDGDSEGLSKDIKDTEIEDLDAEEIKKPKDERLARFASILDEKWYQKNGYGGKEVFYKALKSLLPKYAEHKSGDLIERFLDEKGKDVLNFLTENPFEGYNSDQIQGCAEDKTIEGRLIYLQYEVYALSSLIYFRTLEQMLQLSDSAITSLIYKSPELTVSAVELLLKENPYLLAYAGANFKVSDLDIIAMFEGINLNDELISETRTNAYLHNLMMDKTLNYVASNSILNIEVLRTKAKIGYRLGLRDYQVLTNTGCILHPDVVNALREYFRPDITPNNFSLPRDGWVKDRNSFLRPTLSDIDKALEAYTSSGLGVSVKFRGKEYIMDITNAEKEVYIYSKLNRMVTKSHVDMPNIDELNNFIEAFESRKGFKLEDAQRNAILNLDKGAVCLTGPGGSGKTTVIELLVECIEEYRPKKKGSNEEENQVIFVAPTGAAAKRLKEVVKRQTSTIHSAFQTSGKMTKIYKDESSCQKLSKFSVVIFDEMSMVDLDMMYEVLQRIKEDSTLLLFAGDIEQLPPIGIGKPFATMLTYLPTVKLNVSKRASEGSLITRNAKKVIDESDGVLVDLEEGENFGIEQTKDENEMVMKLQSILNYHMYGQYDGNFVNRTTTGTIYNADDIVVISPINKHNWGVDNINQHLQNMMNPKQRNQREVSYVNRDKKRCTFRKGDKVAHLKNIKDMSRFNYDHETGKLTATNSEGIVNGDLGKVVGIWKPSELPLEANEYMVESDVNKYKSRYNSIFLVCEYDGYSNESDSAYKFCIIYELSVRNEVGSLYEVSPTIGSLLKLGYCLTTHKLQGSAGKLVIVLVKYVGNDFISRNMIYTMITRAREVFYFIGDVKGANSAVNKGRKVMQTNQRQSPIDLYNYSTSIKDFTLSEEADKFVKALNEYPSSIVRDMPDELREILNHEVR